MNKVISILSVLILSSCSCYDSDGHWMVDARYTWYLTFFPEHYYKLTGCDISDTVDAIQIFVTDMDGDSFLPISTIRQKKLVYESRDKKFIDRFFVATQSKVEVEGCSYNNIKEVFHILAYDKTLMRVGYFHYYPCIIRGIHYGKIRPIDDPGLYYSTELAKIFQEIRKMKLIRYQ